MRPRTLRRLVQWRYALRETLLIVIGILIALAFNAWWGQRQDRRREASYIQQLLTDAEANTRILGTSVQEDSVSLKALVILSNALRSGERPGGSSMEVFDVALRYSDPRPVLGNLDHLIASGGVELIRNDSLRASLLEYSSLMHADLAESSRHVDLLLSAMRDWVSRQQNAGLDCPMFVDTSEAERSKCDADFETSWRTLQADSEYRSSVLVVRVATWNRLFYLSRMLEATRRFHQQLASASTD